jgi:hypothetical protein
MAKNNLCNLINEFIDTILHMTNKFRVGDIVYVSRSRARLDINAPSALYRSEIVEIRNRSAKIKLLEDVSSFIPTSALVKRLGILVLKIGDFESEDSLLNPLRESLRHYFSLLLSEGEVLYWDVRSLDELSRFWKTQNNHNAITHVILVGHGKSNSIKFGDTWKLSKEINDILNLDGVFPKQFISLCCETGIANFGKMFSQLPVCESLIAPFQSIHGSIASQFCQTYFNYLLLQGKTSGVSFKKARDATPNATSFRRWKNGKLIS